ncbi:ARMT1-like domain-containing protein [Desulfovibrio litoralis]|uniref:Damage-control phosphatase ARMT1-like metal-binding domain-containing protein n=1 Tax=Desulfovibrio litoralis DSM 11393 TaxID=1121455 RepID=A0A1M7SNM0_9BACT|nr:ARMT1-like domain-containing protein [Desulfovibrio litoralis]SHN60087.1 Protein of unknown function DUF89 [Desulfovibrio litoralis DSM 11393]
MKTPPSIKQVKDIDFSQDPILEAWINHFLTENNIEYFQNKNSVASPEQLKFIVSLQEGQVYIPASDETFLGILNCPHSRSIMHEYFKAWKFIVKLIRSYSLDPKTHTRILNICRLRFKTYITLHIILPSRMIKRLVNIVLSQCADPDPFILKKQKANLLGKTAFDDDKFKEKLLFFRNIITKEINIHELRQELDLMELRRLLSISTMEEIWEEKETFSPEELPKEFKKNRNHLECLYPIFESENNEYKKILFIPDIAGGFFFDLLIIKHLLKLGHQVILAVKNGFYFNAPTIWDVQTDPTLKPLLENAYFLNNNSSSKNELLQALREHRFVIIDDGTKEQLNFYRTSTTFARAWKEADLIVAKGQRNYSALIGSSLSFTRDIISFWRDKKTKEFFIQCKARPNHIKKFSEKDLINIANSIITNMAKAKKEGKTVMFYSAIIGSIPGQTSVAVSVVSTFVKYLRDKLENTFIINPAEHFIQGMDGDDLMYMWERVQRSGYLNVWRFQTTEDIEKSFALMKKKVPSVWSGKDSTFSTGCTKELHIALSVQKEHPELQITGPAPERFFRRSEYGVGKFFDATLSHKK